MDSATLPTNFEQTVRSMKPSEIIMAMVRGLFRRWVNVDMNSFGGFASNRTCYGCAATNTICEIIDRSIPAECVRLRRNRAEFVKSGEDFLCCFELAIDELRHGGHIDFSSYYLKKIGLPKTPRCTTALPCLGDDFTQSDLQKYEAFATELAKDGL